MLDSKRRRSAPQPPRQGLRSPGQHVSNIVSWFQLFSGMAAVVRNADISELAPLPTTRVHLTFSCICISVQDCATCCCRCSVSAPAAKLEALNDSCVTGLTGLTKSELALYISGSATRVIARSPNRIDSVMVFGRLISNSVIVLRIKTRIVQFQNGQSKIHFKAYKVQGWHMADITAFEREGADIPLYSFSVKNMSRS